MTTVLRLIDENASDQALDDALTSAGTDPETARLARRIALRARQAERSQGLVKILYDTATDLSSLRDVDAVLRAIVQRTRAITGSDMAYVSLNDHATGHTYIRESDGVRTDAYRHIRMPLGTGVLGKAATGLATVCTQLYLDDPAIVHLDDIDAIVAGEGVRSILGVPMNVHGRVQGALLIADRRPVTYDDQTREVVDTIARQAALAIDYAAQFSDVSRALASLGAAQDAGQRRLAALQDLLDLDRRMMDAVVTRDGAQSLLGLLTELYAAPAELLAGGRHRQRAIEGAIRSSAATGHAIPIDSAGITVASTNVGPHHFGAVAVHRVIPPDERGGLEHAALYIGLSQLVDQIEVEAEHRSQFEILDDLIAGRTTSSTLKRTRLAKLGIAADEPLSMLTVDSPTHSVAEVTLRVRQVLRTPAVIGNNGRHTCALIQGEFTPLLRRSMAERGLRVGWAPVHGGLDGIPAAHRSAVMALTSLSLLGGNVLDGSSLGMLGALLEAEQDGRLPQPLSTPAAALIEADRRNGTSLVRTAWATLEFGPAAAPVAEHLFIHPNTLRQRWRRISSLLGDGWNSGPGRLDLHMALRVLVLQEAQRTP